MANYTQAGVYELDLQSVAKRIYYSLIYRSTFYKFLNEKYILVPFKKLAESLPVKVVPPYLPPSEGGILLAMNNISPERLKELSRKLKEGYQSINKGDR